MKKIVEFDIVVGGDFYSNDFWQDKLRERGQEGWELAGLIDKHGTVTMVFQRVVFQNVPLPEAAEKG